VDVVDDTAAKLTAVHTVTTGTALDLVFDEDIDAATLAEVDSAEKLLNNFEIIAGTTTVTGSAIASVKLEQPVAGDAKTVRMTLTQPATSGNNLSFSGTVSVSVKATATIKGTDGLVIAPTSAVGVTAAEVKNSAQ
jgi:hypothetical protein